MNSRKKYKSLKFNGFRLLTISGGYSSSSMVTTCSDTRFTVLQDVGIILSGIERNNHIFCGFLSLNYPWDKKSQNALYPI